VLGASVTITDVPWLVNFIKENIQLPENISAISSSESGGSLTVRELSWKSSPEVVLEYLKEANIRPFGQDFDLIIAADVIYTNEAVPMLLTTMWVLSGKETKILLAGEQHNPGSYRVFHEIVDKYFHVEEIEPSKQHSVYQFHPTIRLWSLRKKTGAEGPFPELKLEEGVVV
jgi:predicted nicotinamide N-methyase